MQCGKKGIGRVRIVGGNDAEVTIIPYCSELNDDFDSTIYIALTIDYTIFTKKNIQGCGFNGNRVFWLRAGF